jgi:hypothetical protein
VKLRTLGTVPHGPAFYSLLHGYHAVVVRSLSDEQPRIVHDAYAQAVPILAGDPPGLRDCVEHAKSGMISESNRPTRWAALFAWCRQHPENLEKVGNAGFEMAREVTHREMHRRRWRLLINQFGA